jgi:hypothetical protein
MERHTPPTSHWAGMRWISRFLCMALLAAPGPGVAQSADEELTAASALAMAAFDALELDQARAVLEETLERAGQHGASGRALARVYAQLGLVLTAGFRSRDAGRAAFARALELDGAIEPDPLRATPEVRSVFEQARVARESPREVAENVLGALCDAQRSCEAGLSCREGVCSLPQQERAQPAAPAPRPGSFLRVSTGGGFVLLTGDLHTDREADALLDRQGFVPQLALEAAAGARFGRLALAVAVRAQPLGHGRGTLAGWVLTGRVGVQLREPSATGFSALLYAGLGAGSVQTRVRPRPAGDPWVTSGLVAAQLGLCFVQRLHPRFGIALTTQLNVLAPTWLAAADVLLGPELSF